MLALAPRLNQAEFRISCRVLYRVPANGAAKTAASDGGGGAALSGVVQGPSPLTTSPAELLSFYPGADNLANCVHDFLRAFVLLPFGHHWTLPRPITSLGLTCPAGGRMIAIFPRVGDTGGADAYRRVLHIP